MYKRLMLGLCAGAAVVAAAACSSGGGNVTGNNPLNPTPVPSGFVASPTPASTATSGGATATATPTAAAATATPTSSSTSAGTTPSPTPSPTTTASTTNPAPTPTSVATTSSTGLSTTCAPSTASPVTQTYTLPGPAETINLPSYPTAPPYQIMGTSQVPSQSPANSVLTIELGGAPFNPMAGGNTGTSTSFVTPSGQTADFYTSLEINVSTQFGGSDNTMELIPVTINSPCVVMGRTYTVSEASGGLTIYSETDTPTMNGSVTGHIETALNPFPANTFVYITVSH